MSLAPGTPLGPYQIVGLIGAGGMGEVHRAKDPRLGREVAIKVLPPSFAADQDRLRRFEQEARSAGALNHPNILAVYDIGTHAGGPYLVTELLEGETLRTRLNRGALPPAAALDQAAQIARGLAAAHAKGIVHRDLKPENLFLTRDGRVKILDFGLAKLVRGGMAAGIAGGTMAGEHTVPAMLSESGQISGTAGYMSPEQVRGEAVDHRSDLFALGTVLHEMLTGSHTFLRKSMYETLEAIVKDEPGPLPAETIQQHPELEDILARALAKEPERRFQSAGDFAFVLEMESRRGSSRTGARAGGKAGKAEEKGAVDAAPHPTFHRLTYHRGYILNARFMPDGNSIVYGAAWEGKRMELFSAQAGSPESRPLGIKDAEILSVSPGGELAVSLGHRFMGAFLMRGMLARSPAYGGAAREVLDGIMGADWGPGGHDFIVLRDVEGKLRLEYPMGKTLYETGAWISHVRLSRDGQRIAFIDHPIRGDDGGIVCVVDLKGERRELSGGWSTAQGLAWSADGREVLFTAAAQGANRRMHAATLDGSVRQVLQIPGSITLLDISTKGDILFTHGSERIGMKALAPGETLERDLSWLDWSLIRDLSADGQWILFDETGEGAADSQALYMRKLDGSPAVRLADGVAMRFSPDRKLALGLGHQDRRMLVLVPTGAGQTRVISMGNVEAHMAMWFPDGKSIMFSGHAPGEGVRGYRLDLATEAVAPITPAGYGLLDAFISPDGGLIAVAGADHTYVLQPLDGGDPRPIPGLDPMDRPINWSKDGKGLYISRRGDIPARVDRIDVETGERTLVREILPVDSAGLMSLAPIRMTADAGAYAYSYLLLLHDLYLARGLG